MSAQSVRDAIAAYRGAASELRRTGPRGASSKHRLEKTREAALERLRGFGEHPTAAYLEEEAGLIDTIAQRRAHDRDSPELVDRLVEMRRQHAELLAG